MPTFRQPGYPWTSQFFGNDLPQIPSLKPRVLGAFAQYSGLSGENLRSAFVPGLVPEVRVAYLSGLYGYTPPIGDEIHISKIFVEELEAALPQNRVPRSEVYAPTELEERALLILEATALHEMVHYCRRKFNVGNARVNAMNDRGRGYEEATARQFEMAAYGTLSTVQSLSVARYFPRTAETASK